MIPGMYVKKKELCDLSLRELEDRIYEISKKQNYIAHWGLSEETTKSVIEEFQEQKKGLLELMHKKIDEL